MLRYVATTGAAPKPIDPARAPAFELLGCAILIALGTFTHGWATAHGSNGLLTYHANAGLLGPEVCTFRGCSDTGWDGLSSTLGALALLGGIAAAAVAAASGGLVLAHRRDKLPARQLAIGTFAVAAPAMVVFEIRLLGEDGFAISWSPFVAIGGVVAAAVLLGRLAPLLVPPPPAIALLTTQETLPPRPAARPAPQATPPCARCGAPLTNIDGRWFCPREQRWI
jgi:hypothetical protein